MIFKNQKTDFYSVLPEMQHLGILTDMHPSNA